MKLRPRKLILATAAALVLAASLSATSGAAPSSRADDSTPVEGGTLLAGIPDSPDHLDPGLSYTNEGWEIFEATNNGLLTYSRTDGANSSTIVPDIAKALPTVSKDGLTYTFQVRKGVRFSAPVNRDVRASDFKFTIERLFRINSGGVSFYTGISGANAYAKTKKGGISGIVANDRTGVISFHLTSPDGTFPAYLSIPFAFVVPTGTPDKDVSTIDRWRVATGPYMITKYVPKQTVEIRRNPSFHPWTPNTPGGHLDGIDVKIGVTPEQAVNLTADGALDWYFEPIATDRYTQLKAQFPDQVHPFVRNNVTYFEMNSKKPPFDKLAVRKAVNFAVDRTALVKIFGGQGNVTENILPPGLGTAYKAHHLYPLDVAKAKALVQASGDAGMHVDVWSHTTDPTPKAAQYLASVLDSIGFKTTVKTLDESVYWDTIATQKGDPQIAFQDWNQDYPEAQDFIDTLLNGANIVNVGNNNQTNTNIPALNAEIDRAKQLPLGAARNALWAKLDYQYMAQDASWVPFMNRQIPKYVSKRVHGLVFNPSYFELLPVDVAVQVAGPWQLAWRRLRRNRVALAAGIVFLAIVLACTAGAPLWANLVAHHGPNDQNISGYIHEGGKQVPVVGLDGTPIGPGLRGAYLLGADPNGRDLFVRVLYGGRTSLLVGLASAVLCVTLALILALIAGTLGGVPDALISRLLDLIWSFPVYLLAVALAATLEVGGLEIGPLHVSASSIWLPIVVIAVVFVPYVARPIRGQVLSLRRQEFVEAAVAHGAGPWRVMLSELLPNVASSALIFFTLIVANNILTEAALSFLGVGVPLLTPSWGNIIEQGYAQIVTAPAQTVVPGIAILLTAVSLNVLGDGLRDALDPHGTTRIRG